MKYQGKVVVKNSTKKGEKYFNIVAENGKILATSETYTNDNGLRKGIKAVCDVFRQEEFPIEGIEEVKFEYKYGIISKLFRRLKELKVKTS